VRAVRDGSCFLLDGPGSAHQGDHFPDHVRFPDFSMYVTVPGPQGTSSRH